MRSATICSLAAALLLGGGGTAAAQQMAMEPDAPVVGGQAMFRGKDIIDNAVNSADHTTLVAAVKAAGLVETLKGAGPFTVFAPTNAAFAQLPEGTVPSLLEPRNKEQLSRVLTYHVVPGRYDADALMKLIRKHRGEATLTTVNGAPLRVRMNGERNIVVRDASGNVADISTYDVTQSNGVIHVVDRVLLPS
jgi:uncharacterized surface protein with fasciclin (FAS1) repeats